MHVAGMNLRMLFPVATIVDHALSREAAEYVECKSEAAAGKHFAVAKATFLRKGRRGPSLWQRARQEVKPGTTLTSQSGLPLRFSGEVPVSPTPPHSAVLRTKRRVDVVVAASALVLLAPLFVLVAVSVKFSSPGPIVLRQWREGQGGKVFLCLKFRSLYAHAGDVSGVIQTVRGDRRVTPLGAWLRRTNLDELPQLVNVLRGEMSLVGPRPHVPGMQVGGVPYRQLIPYYDLRLAVPPGLTGWAQVNGWRGPTDTAETSRTRINHDLAYLEHLSIWLDLKIMLLTLWRECTGGTGC